MDPDDEVFKELCETLRQEAAEQVEKIGAVLLDLERGAEAGQRKELLDDAFRHAHNLKGAASSLGFMATSKLAHALETLLSTIGDVPPADAVRHFDVLHRALSQVPSSLANGPSGDTSAEVEAVVTALNKAAASVIERPTNAPRRPGAESELPSELPSEQPSDFPSDAPGPFPVEAPEGGASGSGVADPGDEAGTKLLKPLLDQAGTSFWGGAGLPDLTSIDAQRAVREAGVPAAPVQMSAGEDTLRVSLRKLDALMTQVGELLSARLRTDQRLAELRDLLATEEQRLESFKARRGGLTQDDAIAGRAISVGRMMEVWRGDADVQRGHVKRLRELVRAFEDDALHSTILSGELQEDIRRIQTFPLASVLDPLPRAVRNMATEAGKAVDLTIEGAEIELDKKVLSALRDPVNHLLRNAVDHGIESAAKREQLGKPARASLRIRAEHQGDSIVISISDDGPGVDLRRVRDKAISLGLVSKSKARELSEERIVDFLFAPGMTTKKKATGLSGRGVGLDAVRTMIENLHGTVNVESRPLEGTTFSIILPLTIYAVQALILRAGGHRMALPISAVQRILRVRTADVIQVEQADTIMLDGRPRAIIPLAAVLGLEDTSEPGTRQWLSVVVVGAGELRYALVVDEILGDETLLAKNFEPPLVRVRNVAGATILGDGGVVLMLNPVDLLRTASSRESTHQARFVRDSDHVTQPRLLLADDSATTRTLERNVFETAGYSVVAVGDGREALAALQADGPFDVVVSDVSMPAMTGLELCAAIRREDRFRALPVVLVTSLGSPADRRRGMEVGADAYIVKGEFDHDKLVTTVNELLGRY